ncbi:MAG: IS110 family transposase [Gemmatimonadota bacterium]|nr:MAG: IS110 family transposase [Gemmatimonadota bacterium]
MSSKRIALDRTLVVGVDVASEEHVALIRGPAGLEVGPFPFANDRSGFRLLASKVSEARAASEVEEVALALEPTGSYGEALARWAKREGWRVLGVLGAHTRRAKELWGNSPLKSDAKDARVICDLAVEGKWVTFSLREGAYAELKGLAIYRQQLVRKQTALKHQTRALLYVLFPEFLSVVGRGLFKKSGLMLMERFPTPRSYATIDVDQLTRLLHSCSRGRLGKERAERVLNAAHESVGVGAGLKTRSWVLRRAVRGLRGFEREIAAVEVRMERWLKQIPYGACLLSMPGVGVVTAASLLGECGDLRDYPGTGELLKFCGLNLVSFSSGKRRGRNRISKRGSGLVRHQLYLLAGRLVKQDGAWRAAYNRLRERGAARKAALVALSRKAVRVLFAMVRDNAFYSSPVMEEDLKLAA